MIRFMHFTEAFLVQLPDLSLSPTVDRGPDGRARIIGLFGLPLDEPWYAEDTDTTEEELRESKDLVDLWYLVDVHAHELVAEARRMAGLPEKDLTPGRKNTMGLTSLWLSREQAEIEADLRARKSPTTGPVLNPGPAIEERNGHPVGAVPSGKDYKPDSSKPDYTLLMDDMSETVARVVKVLHWGHYTKGYPRSGYKQLPNAADRLIAATYRHLAEAAKDRRALDSESGELHLVHACTNLLMLLQNLEESK